MNHKKHTLLCKILVLTLGLTGMIPSAHALHQLMLSDGSTTVTITDGGAGDTSANAGVITFNGAIGNFIINVTTGLSKPAVGSATAPDMDVSSVNVSSGSGGTLTIKHTDTDFSSTGPSAIAMDIGGTLRGSITYQTFFDSNNAAFGTSTLLGSVGPLSGPGAFMGSAVGSGPGVDNAYSLTQVITLVHGGGSNVNSSFNAEVQVPEPTATLLLGMGLFGFLGGYSLRRRFQKAA